MDAQWPLPAKTPPHTHTQTAVYVTRHRHSNNAYLTIDVGFVDIFLQQKQVMNEKEFRVLVQSPTRFSALLGLDGMHAREMNVLRSYCRVVSFVVIYWSPGQRSRNETRGYIMRANHRPAAQRRKEPNFEAQSHGLQNAPKCSTTKRRWHPHFSRLTDNCHRHAVRIMYLASSSLSQFISAPPFHLMPTILPAPSPLVSITTKSSATLMPVPLVWKCTLSLPARSGPSLYMNHLSSMSLGA